MVQNYKKEKFNTVIDDKWTVKRSGKSDQQTGTFQLIRAIDVHWAEPKTN